MAMSARQYHGWQKAMQRIAARSWLSWLLARTLYRVDAPLLLISQGRISLAGLIAGLPVIMLTTTGAKTGKPRTTPLVGIVDGEQLVLVASYYGSAHHPAWYHNLRAQPDAAVTVGGQTRTYRAREVTDAEYDHCWQRAVAVYAGFEAYRRRARRRIPIVVLSPP